MNSARTCSDFLADICSAAEKAILFLDSRNVEQLRADEKTAFAVIRALEVIGEATKRIPADIRLRYPEVPWRSMAGIRDKLIHDYVAVNLDVVWKTVAADLPPLISVLKRIVLEVVDAETREGGSTNSGQLA